MTRRTFAEQRAYVECDACGYPLQDAVKAGSERDRDFAAPVTVRLRDGEERHFHAVDGDGYSCFDYWLRTHADDQVRAALLGAKP